MKTRWKSEVVGPDELTEVAETPETASEAEPLDEEIRR